MYGLFKNNEQLGPLHSTKEGVMAEAFSHGAVAKMGVPDFPDQPDRSGELVLMNGFSVREVTAPLDLDAIRERVERYKHQPSELHPYSLWTQAAADITALLGEVEKLKAGQDAAHDPVMIKDQKRHYEETQSAMSVIKEQFFGKQKAMIKDREALVELIDSLDPDYEAVKILTALEAEGLVVVPVYPTPEMVEAVRLGNVSGKHWTRVGEYRAMLAASPFKEKP